MVGFVFVPDKGFASKPQAKGAGQQCLPTSPPHLRVFDLSARRFVADIPVDKTAPPQQLFSTGSYLVAVHFDAREAAVRVSRTALAALLPGYTHGESFADGGVFRAASAGFPRQTRTAAAFRVALAGGWASESQQAKEAGLVRRTQTREAQRLPAPCDSDSRSLRLLRRLLLRTVTRFV